MHIIHNSLELKIIKRFVINNIANERCITKDEYYFIIALHIK